MSVLSGADAPAHIRPSDHKAVSHSCHSVLTIAYEYKHRPACLQVQLPLKDGGSADPMELDGAVEAAADGAGPSNRASEAEEGQCMWLVFACLLSSRSCCT